VLSFPEYVRFQRSFFHGISNNFWSLLIS
jgi:hypothetical protein